MKNWADDNDEMDFSSPIFENEKKSHDIKTDNFVVNLDNFLKKFPHEFVPYEKLKERLSIFKKITK
jgi:hypothetical protein